VSEEDMTTGPGGHGAAVFVHEVSRVGQIGPLAPWVTMANWAAAARRRYGNAWLITPEGVLSPRAALELASNPARPSHAVSQLRKQMPEPLVTFAKDARRVVRNRRFREGLDVDRWRSLHVPYVTQLHGLFCDAGLELADDLGVPSVLVVDACQVEEARSWGVGRPGWSTMAERLGEVPQLRAADLVTCVSEEVAASVTRMTGRVSGVEVVPNGVDTDFFSPGDNRELRSALGLDDAFVVGWTGSFRSFHGLDDLFRATAMIRRDIPGLALLLVGDGLERPALELLGEEMDVRVVFPGTVPYHEVPQYLRAMDVAVVLAPPDGPFHYSPVKLREYQACGVPVIASAVGEMRRDLEDGTDALLVEQGDVVGLGERMLALSREPALAARISERARALVLDGGSWVSRLVDIERMLGIDEDRSRPAA
jgi:glycosyltransferase involved in cell wall biosynthesis